MNQNLLAFGNILLKNSVSIVLSIGLIIVGSLGYQYYKDTKKVTDQLIGLEEQYKQLNDFTASLQTQYRTEKEIWNKSKSTWEKERKELEGKLKAIASATFTIKSFPKEQDKPDLVTDNELIQEVQFVDETGLLGPVVGVVKIKNDTGATYSKIVDHEIKIDSAIVKDPETGRIRVLAKGWYIQKEQSLNGQIGKPDWKDKPYPLKITGGELIINPNDPSGDDILKKKFRFAPHLNTGGFLGTALGALEYGAHIDMSFWGYGYTKNDLDYKLGAIGVNFAKDYIDVDFVPVKYRIGNHIPLVDDLYLGPGIGFGSSGTSIFLSLDTTL